MVFSRHSEYIPQFLCHYNDFKDFWAIGWAGPKVFWRPFIFRFVMRRWVTWSLRNLPEITYLIYDSTNMPALFRYKAYDLFYHFFFFFFFSNRINFDTRKGLYSLFFSALEKASERFKSIHKLYNSICFVFFLKFFLFDLLIFTYLFIQYHLDVQKGLRWLKVTRHWNLDLEMEKDKCCKLLYQQDRDGDKRSRGRWTWRGHALPKGQPWLQQAAACREGMHKERWI